MFRSIIDRQFLFEFLVVTATANTNIWEMRKTKTYELAY